MWSAVRGIPVVAIMVAAMIMIARAMIPAVRTSIVAGRHAKAERDQRERQHGSNCGMLHWKAPL